MCWEEGGEEGGEADDGDGSRYPLEISCIMPLPSCQAHNTHNSHTLYTSLHKHRERRRDEDARVRFFSTKDDCLR